MRIAIVVKSLAIGGMEKVAVTLADAFHEKGYETHLIYFKHKGNVLVPKNPLLQHNFALKRQMNLSGIGLLWKFIAKFLNLLFKRSYPLWIGLLSAPLFKYQFKILEKEYGGFDLVIFRGQGTFEMVWPLRDKRFVFVNESVLCANGCGVLQQLYGKLLFNNRNVANVSENVTDTFLTLQKKGSFQTNKMATITNPIDVTHTQEQANAYQPDIHSPYILSVGRLVPLKNIPLLVEAYAYARENLGLTLPLVIVGDGKERKNIEKKINELKLNTLITLTGKLSNPYPWMKHAELFVLSSKFEGLGMVLLEAMACGTNVVATDSSSGVQNVMTGELKTHLAEQNAAELATKIMEVLKEERIDFSPYLQNYLPETIADSFIDTYTASKPANEDTNV